ncbi:LysR substrate-binding domain-containing protein [Arcticibacterium luteifluviistationis]|uniref:DNA-binding transcriptional regulator OxyR n=1 Tax=Arcticibacterium luteifluviistationis TaxID=1784714 RepID=A0A2Z4GCK4_9BACT|nr:LysR substrate-binding domain-containing protein [Arcticibacterium luteifluviistationis]AWV99032.1 DNA-binding transcriptional regulator OxyR [Arcticibacterium luteifluviistationis]
MNIQQLEYLLAVDQHRHFARAAEACSVTQPTLSMMIQKLEDELGLKVFDRSRQPVCPTDAGENLINQARQILLEVKRFEEIASTANNYIGGELRVGVIPTIAPYLLPLFIQAFVEKYSDVKLKISELITEQILFKLDKGELDVGILVAPENDKTIKEIHLYNEAFVVYTPKKFDKEYLLAEDIDVNKLLLLEEGHCFRSQIMKFCELRKQVTNKVEYTSGSLETLRYLADKHLGITILPELATLHLTKEQLKNVKQFAAPKPVRKVSLVTKRDFVKKRLVEVLSESIKVSLPQPLHEESVNLISFES